jgi:glycosyltransferase involved in cell wall biosynthesis
MHILSMFANDIQFALEPTAWASDASALSVEEESVLSVLEKRFMGNVPPDSETVLLNMTIPPLFSTKMRGINVGLYMFEANKVPDSWVEKLRSMDYLITLTEFNRKQLEDAGIQKEVFMLPASIEPTLFHPGIEPMLPKGDKFSFLHVSVAHPRKRWKTIITSFLEEFDKEPVRLILKLEPTVHGTKQEIDDFIGKVRTATGSKAEIFLCTSRIDGNIASLYTSADCYVSISAEGFCLPAFEAVACGVPCILLNWSGYTEWFGEKYGWWIPVGYMETVRGMEGFDGYDDKSLSWAVPAQKDVQAKMRYAFEHPKECKEKGAVGADEIIHKYNAKKVGREFFSSFLTTLSMKDANKTVHVGKDAQPEISVAMITRNSAGLFVDGKNVFKSNLSILKRFADEIVVVDGGSVDGTDEIAKGFGARVYQYKDKTQGCGYCAFEKCGDRDRRAELECFSKFRQASFKLCKGKWIFRIDADEMIAEENISEFKKILVEVVKRNPYTISVAFPTVNFWGAVPFYRIGWDGSFSWYPDFHARLYKNIPEMHNWFCPAHESVNISTSGGWKTLLAHRQNVFVSSPSVFHYGYLKKDCGARNSRYSGLGMPQHYLGDDSIYSLGTFSWDKALPKLSE